MVTKGQGAWEGDLNSANEVSFAYSVWFEDGFEFNKGGKMPGVYGGTTEELAMGCSGGRQEGRDDCFSSRLMWREFRVAGGSPRFLLHNRPGLILQTGFVRTGTDSAGESYNYFPTSVQQSSGYCSTGPMSECNPQYGDSSESLSRWFHHPVVWVGRKADTDGSLGLSLVSSVGRGSFGFDTGRWVTVAQRIKLNDVGQSNG